MTDVAVDRPARPARVKVRQPPAADAGSTHPCDVCPARSTAQDSSFGYCEGCTGRLRLCRSCERYQPQTGWGPGFFGLTWRQAGWVCADCRVQVADAVADHPRFQLRLGLSPHSRVASQVARELERAADQDHHHPAVEVLRRIAGGMTPAGDVDVDVAEFSLADRRAVQTVLQRLAGEVPHPVAPTVYALVRAWGRFVDDCAAPPEEPRVTLSVAQRVAHLERDA